MGRRGGWPERRWHGIGANEGEEGGPAKGQGARGHVGKVRPNKALGDPRAAAHEALSLIHSARGRPLPPYLARAFKQLVALERPKIGELGGLGCVVGLQVS